MYYLPVKFAEVSHHSSLSLFWDSMISWRVSTHRFWILLSGQFLLSFNSLLIKSFWWLDLHALGWKPISKTDVPFLSSTTKLFHMENVSQKPGHHLKGTGFYEAGAERYLSSAQSYLWPLPREQFHL